MEEILHLPFVIEIDLCDVHGLHGFCAGRHLSTEIVCVLVNGEDRAKVEEEAQKPCHRADEQNGSFDVVHVCNNACDDGSGCCTKVFKKVFHSLRRRTNFWHGDIVVIARNMNNAPSKTPTLETMMRPLLVRLKAKSPSVPPTKYPAAKIRMTGAIVKSMLLLS